MTMSEDGSACYDYAMNTYIDDMTYSMEHSPRPNMPLIFSNVKLVYSIFISRLATRFSLGVRW